MIRLDRVTFRYPQTTRPSLDRVSFRVEPHTITLVTGPLGAGCSTLLLVAAGLAPYLTGGTLEGLVRILGVEAGSAEAHAQIAGRVGFLLSTPWHQLSGVSYTVADEVAFGPANLGRPRARIAQAVDRAMELAGVTHLADRDPATLSGGELQRVMLAGVIALEPDVYLLDEPTVELDPVAAESFYHVLPELARSAAVVVATTEADQAVTVADRVVLLEAGRCEAEGKPAEVLGAEKAVSAGRSTTAAQIARAAGVRPPYPLTADTLVKRIGP